jgi:anaerobic selenocysteine-containing dehydrogenase
VILDEDLFDKQFVAEEVSGVESLRHAVDLFTPEHVGERAGVAATDVSRAARMFAAAGRGYAVTSTGGNMSGPGTLVEYLVLCLNTICGRWLRAGERVSAPFTLHAQSPPKAQAVPPVKAHGIGEPLTVSGAFASLAGYPTAALPGAILLGDETGVKALISCGGNPGAAWPDQLQTIEAMKALELLVRYGEIGRLCRRPADGFRDAVGDRPA